MVNTRSVCENGQVAYDAACVMRLVAEKQARRAALEFTKGEKNDE